MMKRMMKLKRMMKGNQKRRTLLVLMLALLLFATGCSTSSLKVGYVSTSIGSEFSASYYHFNGTESRRIKAEEGETLSIQYETEVKRGSLDIWIQSPDGETIDLATGETTVDSIEIPVEESGYYRLMVVGDSTRGSFDFDWSR